MRVVGIIAEYNPLHNGHRYQIEQAKKITSSDYCIVIMSGHFVQRGEPAILDKWTRAQMALKNGADLVIELPVHFSTASAEYFSFASVNLLEQLGMVDSLCFGSEIGNVQLLESIARILVNEPVEYKAVLASFMEQGYSFVTSRAMAFLQYINESDYSKSKDTLSTIIKSPNNILGIEYIKALIKLGSSIKPYTIKRIGAHYHDESMKGDLASATAIRKAILGDQQLNSIKASVPHSAYQLMAHALNQKQGPVYLDDYSSIIKYKLLMLSSKDLDQYVDINEGIENRLKELAKKHYHASEIVRLANTKRYPHAKIRRALIHILLDIKKEAFTAYTQNDYAQYIRLLGFRNESRELLKNIKKHTMLPIISNVKDAINRLDSFQKNMLLEEIKATECYNLILKEKYNTTMKNDYNQQMMIV